MEKPPADEPLRPNEGRLDSWKKIAVYLKRDVTTVQRWEKREGMPVHRQLHDKMGSVYAFRSELDAWMQSRVSRIPQAPPSLHRATPPPSGSSQGERNLLLDGP